MILVALNKGWKEVHSINLIRKGNIKVKTADLFYRKIWILEFSNKSFWSLKKSFFHFIIQLKNIFMKLLLTS